MSDNDLIRRGDVVEYIKTYQCAKCSDIGSCWGCAVLIALKLIEDAPAVPHEMTAREYLYHRNRICHARYAERQDDDEFLCEKCVLKEACAPSNEAAVISKSIAIVEQWEQEHPERSEE